MFKRTQLQDHSVITVPNFIRVFAQALVIWTLLWGPMYYYMLFVMRPGV